MGYGQNEFGYRLYDPVNKKLIRSRDIVFMEDQIITNIGKMEKVEFGNNDKLIDLEMISPTLMANQLDVKTQNGQHGAGDDSEPVEVRNSNDVLDQPQIPQATHIDPPRRTTRNHQSFTRYSHSLTLRRFSMLKIAMHTYS